MPRYYKEHQRGYDLTEELPFIEIDGEKYQLGSAGSLILICPQCGHERFREHHHPGETCWTCKGVPMEKLRLADLPKYRAMWTAQGDTLTTVEQRKAQRLQEEVERPWNWVFGDKTEADFPLGYVKSSSSDGQSSQQEPGK
jgi:hypothetical protein